MTGGGGGEEEVGRRNTASTVSSGEAGSSQGLVVTTTSHSSSRGCREEVGEGGCREEGEWGCREKVGEWRGEEVVEERCHCFSLCLEERRWKSGVSSVCWKCHVRGMVSLDDHPGGVGGVLQPRDGPPAPHAQPHRAGGCSV